MLHRLATTEAALRLSAECLSAECAKCSGDVGSLRLLWLPEAASAKTLLGRRLIRSRLRRRLPEPASSERGRIRASKRRWVLPECGLLGRRGLPEASSSESAGLRCGRLTERASPKRLLRRRLRNCRFHRRRRRCRGHRGIQYLLPRLPLLAVFPPDHVVRPDPVFSLIPLQIVKRIGPIRAAISLKEKFHITLEGRCYTASAPRLYHIWKPRLRSMQ